MYLPNVATTSRELSGGQPILAFLIVQFPWRFHLKIELSKYLTKADGIAEDVDEVQ